MVLNFLNQLSNAGSLRVFHNGMWLSWNSEVHVCLVHHYWCMTVVMISHGFFHFLRSSSSSTLKVSLSWKERTRELSFASAVLRVATGRTVLSEETDFFAKRINIDLLKTGRVSHILHVIRSPQSFTNWIWNWLGWFGKILLVENFTFWLSSNFHCGRRCTEKSICSGSLWFSSLGSMGKKNTVCLLLESWPPGTNPLLLIEWRLNAHPMW